MRGLPSNRFWGSPYGCEEYFPLSDGGLGSCSTLPRRPSWGIRAAVLWVLGFGEIGYRSGYVFVGGVDRFAPPGVRRVSGGFAERVLGRGSSPAPSRSKKFVTASRRAQCGNFASVPSC
jgi:hypothetical protein